MNAVGQMSSFDRWRMYAASCMSLATGAMIFIVRADIQETLRTNLGVTSEEIGGVMGLWALGIAVTILISSPLCDVIGMGNMLRAASVLQCISIPITVYTNDLTLLKGAVLASGLAHGFIEGSINPLIATIYPDQKIHKLNVLHAWWPGGLVIGGLSAYGLTNLGVTFQAKFSIILLPAIVYGLLTMKLQFPKTERHSAGVSPLAMLREAIRPGFILIFLCMFATAATELGPNQWMETVLKDTAKLSGTMVLTYISSLMFVMRFFAGALAHKINPVGILCLSSVLSCFGLLGLSVAREPVVAYVAATVFAVGVCYYWPTMLGYVGEQFPKGGAFTMGLMGTAGMTSIIYVLPMIGRWRDLHGAAGAFQRVAVIPIFLVAIFGILFAWYQVKGGYKAVSLRQPAKVEEAPA